MKQKRRMSSIFMTLMLVIPLLVGLFGLKSSVAAVADAPDDKVNVTLHKKKMDEFPLEYVQNTGNEMTEFDRYEGLNGVTFKAYDITKTFYEQVDEKLAQLPSHPHVSEAERETAVKAVMKDYQFVENSNTLVKEGTTANANGKDGILTFNDLPSKENGNYKVYYFAEQAGADYTAQALPLILALPALNATSNELKDIHLYPKNKVANVPEKDLLGEGKTPLPEPSNKYHDFEIGKEIHYQARFTIPYQIGDMVKDESNTEIATRYSKLSFEDAVTQDQVQFNTVKVKIADKEIPESEYGTHADLAVVNAKAAADSEGKFTAGNKAGFKFALKLNDKKASEDQAAFNESKATVDWIKQYAGEEIVFDYSVTLTKHTPVDEAIGNKFVVGLGQHGKGDESKEADAPEIGTGGQKFVKHAAGNENDLLKGAEFVVVRSNNNVDEYLSTAIDQGTGEAKWVPVKDSQDYKDAKRYTSNEAGKLEVTGLKNGEYALRELKSPNGYQLLTEDFKFTITPGSYDETALLKVANTPKGFLPSTGGIGIVAFLLVGAILMVGVAIKYRRTHHEVI